MLAQMPPNFGLTMAPETAYVTGGSVVYGSIWGAVAKPCRVFDVQQTRARRRPS
ncbi:hypothetical protein ACFXJ8_07765 [Nonomuraea sp. NPDC059194]|uniref:hypothetical protein n=1 Tax=Nonomuraea sp. NPDC059194 TaxID=3346764 RepID=UPI0036A4A035